jgi:acetyl esterase/lipase
MVYLISFAEKGYMTGTVSYRLKRDSIYPASVEDVSDAVEWVFKNGENFGYDPHRVALIGGSAGAHLSMLAAYGWRDSRSQMDSIANNNQIKAVVDIYGPVDLTDDYAQTQPLVTGFMGHSYREKPELYKEASPITYLSKNAPPTLILHGTSDKLVPIHQSDTLKSRLDELEVPCEYYKLPFWPHAMDIATRVNDFSQKKMEEFFEKYLLR